jgi:predicted ArsR family transcriptional regulator
MSHDLWRNRIGLGKNAYRVHRALNGAPGASVKQLAVGLGLDPRTVKNHLDRLHASGLVDQDDDCWFVTRANLDFVAADIGSLGRGEAQRQLHDRQRQAFDNRNTSGCTTEPNAR